MRSYRDDRAGPAIPTADVYRGGVLIATVTGTSYRDNSLGRGSGNADVSGVQRWHEQCSPPLSQR